MHVCSLPLFHSNLDIKTEKSFKNTAVAALRDNILQWERNKTGGPWRCCFFRYLVPSPIKIRKQEPQCKEGTVSAPRHVAENERALALETSTGSRLEAPEAGEIRDPWRILAVSTQERARNRGCRTCKASRTNTEYEPEAASRRKDGTMGNHAPP